MSDTKTLERPAKRKVATAPPPEMRLTVERAALLVALADVQAIVERRNTIPILSNVKLEAAGDSLTLTGTDLDREVRLTVPAAVAAAGETTVSSELLFNIVREMPDGAQIELTAGDGKLTVVGGRARYRLHMLPASEFPSIGCGEMSTAFSLSAKELRATLAKLSHAQSTEEARYYLNGIALDVSEPGRLTAAATDGFCLATAWLPMPDGAAGMPTVIIPRKTVAQLLRLLEDEDCKVSVTLSATRLRFEFGTTVLISKAVDGTYPDWRRVIPPNNELVLSLDASDLETGIRRVTTVADGRSRAVRFAIERARLTLSVTSVANGTAADEIPVAYEQDPIAVTFNAKFIQDTLRAMGMDTADIALTSAAATAPVAALFTNPADKSARWVVMSMLA